MANLPEPANPGWPGVFQIETTTIWAGGEQGPANFQGKNLLERTDYLKERADEVDDAKEGMPSLKDRIESIGSSPKALYKKDFVPDAPVAASTANVDIVTGGLLVIDGVQTAAGDLVFLKDQTDPVENGFWEVQTGAWNRYDGYTNGETECFTQKLIDIHSGTNRGLIFVIDVDAYVVGQTALNFKETYLSTAKTPGTVLFRNRDGEVDDLIKMFQILTSHGEACEGRNLADVLKANSLTDLTNKISERCNDTGKPYFSEMMIGDYVDGIDLSSILAENGGDAGQAWNDTYKNNRIVLSGFNTYKSFGDTEIPQNHVLFSFRDIPLRKRMNPTDTNTGGYIASEARAFLEGLNGDGTGDMANVTTAAFLNALKAQLGADRLLTLRKAHSIKSSQAWANYTLFLPSELEVTGYPTYGDEGVYMPAITSPAIAARAGWNTNVQFPIFSQSGFYRIKRYNGARMWYFLQTPYSASAAAFCSIAANGATSSYFASAVGGCAPAFCVR
jgi:hypothetical protein